MGEDIESACKVLRDDIESLKGRVALLLVDPAMMDPDGPLEGVNIPNSRNGNMAANITLVFRALEDARMRLGKVMQAFQGGISIFDKK